MTERGLHPQKQGINHERFVEVLANDSLSKGTIFISQFGSQESEKLEVMMEPNKVTDIYAFCVKKENIMGHLPKGLNGTFAKTIFFFHRADELS